MSVFFKTRRSQLSTITLFCFVIMKSAVLWIISIINCQFSFWWICYRCLRTVNIISIIHIPSWQMPYLYGIPINILVIFGIFRCFVCWVPILLSTHRHLNRFRFIAIWKIHYKDMNISLRTYKRIANLTKCKRIEDSTKYCFHPNPDSLLWYSRQPKV